MSLREEYTKYKLFEKQIKKQEISEWLSENVLVLTEKLDRSKIKRLVNLIVKFDEKLGPFKEKLPGVSSVIEDAENALQNALSGKMSNAKVSDIFQRLSLIYSILSDFFANDLSLLLQTPAFKAPRKNPEVRLDSISDSGYNPKNISDTIVVALTPSPEELALLNKLYRGVKLPQLNREEIANQLLSLCYKDLESLCGIEQLPMAIVPSNASEETPEPEATQS